MLNPQQRRWTAEEKLKILEEARQAGQSVSEVCRRHQIAPGQFYLWERQARHGALQALRDGKRGRKVADPTARFQTELTRLRATVAELSTENLQLKKGRWP
ncbi:MAG: transposase [Armatimonadota bacterium]